MPHAQMQKITDRPTAEYLVQSRDHRVSETFRMRDDRYTEVDRMLAGEWGYTLPGDNVIAEKPIVMNLGLAFTQDISRLVPEQTPVYKSPVYSDKQSDIVAAQIRETIAETYWADGRGDLLVPQYAIDLAVCGAAYTVCWIDPDDSQDYPAYTRVDPRHAYPNIQNGKLLDLLVISVYPADVAEYMYPGNNILTDSRGRSVKSEVEVWEFYSPGYASRAVAHLSSAGGVSKDTLKIIDEVSYDYAIMPAAYTQIPSHDGAIRGMLDQLGNSLQAKNKIASLMTKYTEHKVFAPWEAKGIDNPLATPGPNTVYVHNDLAPGETFMRRVQPAGSDPALFALMNLLDLDQRGGIGYPASRQGEVSQSIASAAFVESSQGQLSSIVKSAQVHEADLRAQTMKTLFAMDVAHKDYEKPLIQAVGKKNTYTPSKDIKDKTYIRVMYGAGAGMSRSNADTRVLNLLGARIIDRGTARDNIEFLRDRTDIQDKIEQENAEDSLQQLFWPDPAVPIDIKFEVKKRMKEQGLGLTEAWDEVKAEFEAKQAADQAAQQAAQAQAQPVEGMPQDMGQGAPSPTAAEDQALALEKGAIVSEPADINLPPAPMQQSFITNER